MSAGFLSIAPHTLSSIQLGMCEELLADAGFDPADHPGVAESMAFAADLAAVDAAYEVMREHGLPTLADREAQVWRLTGEGRRFLDGNRPMAGMAGMAGLCLVTLGLLGGTASTTEVRKGLEDDGIRLTPPQTRTSLWHLARVTPRLAELARPGRAGYGTAGVWQLTGYGWDAFLAETKEPVSAALADAQGGSQ